MEQAEVLRLFEEYNALLTGHFKLSSGLHSQRYLQCALVLQYPAIAEKMASALAGRFVRNGKVDVVVGPALGGVTLAYEVARSLGVRGIFTERENGTMTLRRGFFINPGERAVVVEDVVTTGGSSKEVMDVITRAGGVVVGIGSIIDRSDLKPAFNVPYEALARVKVDTYNEETCPLCRQNVPIAKPGSKR